jgi:cytochrome c peroxidase
VALTAPYMHDGAYDDLEQAVRHHLDPMAALAAYDGSGLPDDLRSQVHAEAASAIAAHLDPETAPYRPLDDGEIAAIVAFLGALTSRTELALPLGAGIPGAVPSGLAVDTLRTDGDVLPP